MRVDRYVKTLLTLIALCLIWISVRGAMPSAKASDATVPVAGQQVEQRAIEDYRVAWNRAQNRGIVQLKLARTNQLVNIENIPSAAEIGGWISILSSGKATIDSNGWILTQGQGLMK